MPVPETEVYLYEKVIISISCCCSFLGSTLIIATHGLWPDLRTKPRQLLVYLSVADLLSAVSYLYGVLRDFDSSSWDCVLQGALSTFANTSSFFWTVAIAIYLYIIIVRSDQHLAGSLCVLFHAVSWSVPLVITVAAVSLRKIGYDASDVSVGWCWVSILAEDHFLWMLLTGKIWEFIAYITLPILYIRIKKHINRAHEALSEYRPILSSSSSYHSRSSSADLKLTLIPIIFILLRIWSTVRFILTLCGSPVVENRLLVTLHGVGNTFQGAANCIMFILCTKPIRLRLISSLCSFCRNEDDKSMESESKITSRQASTSLPSPFVTEE
ncbi:G-protein coupled receptor 157 [Callorhinchus milii]|uniref:G protein-coupled receptor 157 n=1 Tax=Callorhinchus milii TaxID=7868 RepID=A0A4W3GN33_CALMI|nr:G-protein coupled receptor 157 [Callorhinchus milii]|eukprot:gi/632967916/ref/XP_007900248.1/ PREDICTED: probable G-protein coupled receptor 157 [Callorhinchus milii]